MCVSFGYCLYCYLNMMYCLGHLNLSESDFVMKNTINDWLFSGLLCVIGFWLMVFLSKRQEYIDYH